MGNKLAILAIAGLSISAVSLTAAAMVGGQELRDKGFDIFNWESKPRCNYVEGSGSDRRLLNWSGEDDITIALDAEVHYTPNGSDMIEITGSPERLSHIRVRNGKIDFDCNGNLGDGNVRITLPGQKFESFSIFGDAHLFLENLEQDSVEISVTGDGMVEASGRTDKLELNLIGDARANMARLVTRDVEINIIGDGNADISPLDSLESNIVGDGTIRLHSEPKEIETNTVGAGRIIHAAPPKAPI